MIFYFENFKQKLKDCKQLFIKFNLNDCLQSFKLNWKYSRIRFYFCESKYYTILIKLKDVFYGVSDALFLLILLLIFLFIVTREFTVLYRRIYYNIFYVIISIIAAVHVPFMLLDVVNLCIHYLYRAIKSHMKTSSLVDNDIDFKGIDDIAISRYSRNRNLVHEEFEKLFYIHKDQSINNDYSLYSDYYLYLYFDYYSYLYCDYYYLDYYYFWF